MAVIVQWDMFEVYNHKFVLGRVVEDPKFVDFVSFDFTVDYFAAIDY